MNYLFDYFKGLKNTVLQGKKRLGYYGSLFLLMGSFSACQEVTVGTKKVAYYKQNVLNICWSPDQKRLMFVYRFLDEDIQSPKSHIYQVDLDGKNLDLVTDQVTDPMPHWRPDGEGFYFSHRFVGGSSNSNLPERGLFILEQNGDIHKEYEHPNAFEVIVSPDMAYLLIPETLHSLGYAFPTWNPYQSQALYRLRSRDGTFSEPLVFPKGTPFPMDGKLHILWGADAWQLYIAGTDPNIPALHWYATASLNPHTAEVSNLQVFHTQLMERDFMSLPYEHPPLYVLGYPSVHQIRYMVRQHEDWTLYEYDTKTQQHTLLNTLTLSNLPESFHLGNVSPDLKYIAHLQGNHLAITALDGSGSRNVLNYKQALPKGYLFAHDEPVKAWAFRFYWPPGSGPKITPNAP